MERRHDLGSPPNQVSQATFPPRAGCLLGGGATATGGPIGRDLSSIGSRPGEPSRRSKRPSRASDAPPARPAVLVPDPRRTSCPVLARTSTALLRPAGFEAPKSPDPEAADHPFRGGLRQPAYRVNCLGRCRTYGTCTPVSTQKRTSAKHSRSSPGPQQLSHEDTWIEDRNRAPAAPVCRAARDRRP